MGSKLQTYLEAHRGKRIVVIGIGVSNTPLIRLLAEAGAQVTACDKMERADLGPVADELEALGVSLRLGQDYLTDLEADIVFRSPGIRPDVPEIASLVTDGAILTSEMEAFLSLCPCPIIGVTGSDGKTTTTTIISKLLETAGYTVHLGGNIGRPLLPDVDSIQATDIVALEMSSFQLMTIRQCPGRAVVTNMFPNHLDVHKSMEEYIAAKENIYLHQHPTDRLVINYDNEITHAFGPKARGQVTYFSRSTKLEEGFFLLEGTLWMARDGQETAIIRRSDIALPGIHNVDNYLAAFAATEGLVDPAIWREVAMEFGGVEHRIEFVRELNGVTYYNDSIASSPTRTIAGLQSFDQKVILIAGGYDKQIPYQELGEEINLRVKHLILTGHTAEKIKDSVEQAPGGQESTLEVVLCDDLPAAVRVAYEVAEAGDVVILSPAAASFDQFKNFDERGKVFKQLVFDLG
ncbi:MAG: UDP-N-acetylmuramoyl-L-alanine--D-glutamate ligase [Oscillospiraceae bacterium]|nr:UDP-N-acetylmuramoyl-L-alanine--D-glutamate ligase [Oscillospiraceae bacterium]